MRCVTLGFLLLSAAAPTALTGSGCSGDESCAACMVEKCQDLIDVCEVYADCACLVMCTGDHGIGGVAACLST